MNYNKWFEHFARKPDWSRWWTVVIYAVAMAWVESAVVFYLRSMIGRIEPHQPAPLPVIGGFALVELPREFATMVMLFAVGFLAGRTWRARIGYAAIAFGVWDIFYYVFLKMMCGWPHSLLDWDILFLLPLPWWGPVLAPVLISLLMILWGTFASQFERKTDSGAVKLARVDSEFHRGRTRALCFHVGCNCRFASRIGCDSHRACRNNLTGHCFVWRWH